MTRMANARIAGSTFLIYIAAGIASMVIASRIRGDGAGIAAKLAAYAQHPTAVGVIVLLAFPMGISALVLGVTLWAITREEDAELAMFGMMFRVGEGVIGMFIPVSVTLLWLATASGTDTLDATTARALGVFVGKLGGWNTLISATFFA